MLFKQIQLFQLTDSCNYSAEHLTEQFEQLKFMPCLPSMSVGMGWAPVLDDNEAPLLRAVNDCIMFCLQIEEKVLPAAVITQQLNEKIKLIEAAENRRIRQKEKLSLRDEITITLLPRAFTKMVRVYAYIDNKNHWLVLGTTNAGKTEQFMSIFKKTITENIAPLKVKKPSSLMTQWLKDKNYPTAFAIEKACVLQDPTKQTRVIRCQQQDLFSTSIQSLLRDSCEAKQLALSWQDQVNFVLADDFSLRSIQFQDEIRQQVKEMEPETAQQQFDADFMIMSGILAGLVKDLLHLFADAESLPEVNHPVDELAVN